MAAILSVVSGVIGAIGSMQAANAQAAAANTQAAIAERNKRTVLAQADAEAVDKTRENRRQLATVRAAYGASGIDLAGTPLDVLEDSASELQYDVSKIRYQGELRAIGYQDEAMLKRMEAKQAKASGPISAVGKLFGGFSSAGSSLMRT